MMASRMLVIWSLSYLDNGTRMPCPDGFDSSTGSSMNCQWYGIQKRLIKIPSGTDCYYCINNMTYLIHVYYCLVILVIRPDILPTSISHIYCALHVETLFIYMNTLHSMYSLFYVFFTDTLLLYMVILRTSCIHVHNNHDPLMLLLLLVQVKIWNMYKGLHAEGPSLYLNSS